MKPALAITLVLAAAAVGVVACGGTHRRSDWRGPPAAATACVTAEDCSGAPCEVSPGATQATCQPIGLIHAPRADGGARPPAPPPALIQPSPNDIQI
jgi:hypothetical protein